MFDKARNKKMIGAKKFEVHRLELDTVIKGK